MLQQQAKRQGSPWRSPGAKAPSPRASPRVARPAGFEAQLLEPEDLAWESPSIRRSSSAQPSCPNETSSDHQAAPKEAADPSSGPQSGDGSVLGSQEGSPDKVQGGSGRHEKGLSSYPLVFSQKADVVKRLTDKKWRRSSRSKGSSQVSRHSDTLLAVVYLLSVTERQGVSLSCDLLCHQTVSQLFIRLFIPSFARSLTHSFIHSFIHSLTHSRIQSFSHSFSWSSSWSVIQSVSQSINQSINHQSQM